MRFASIHTLGCRLNRADSDLIADSLRRAGFCVVDWGEPADLVVINGCVVTSEADRKTRRAARAARRANPDAFVVLAGCAAESAAGDVPVDLPVDLVLPNVAKSAIAHHLPALLRRSVACAPRVIAAEPRAEAFVESGTAFPRGRTRANVKIQEGCDFCCTYCIVPHVRGAPRSRDRADVLREVSELVEMGVQELVLTGVHTSLYQSSAGGLTELIDAILSLDQGVRVRVSSLEPGPEIEPLIERMASEPRICRFLHLPVQHADDGVLERMGRRTGFAEFAQLVTRAAEAVPGICLGTDLIVGFPGEDERAFETCRKRIAGLPLGLMHVFPFSPRPGTPAATFAARPSKAVVDERRREMLNLAEAKAADFARSQVGCEVRVLIEKSSTSEGSEGWSGNYLRVRLDEAWVRSNRLIDVRVTDVLDGRVVRGRALKFT
ncbi:MAG: tRNA (N(6)-L-threonylcarbamoyladenosine(37)-C(2))-methylthiotransferase MtaB [Verrucomicrobiota bacterium]